MVDGRAVWIVARVASLEPDLILALKGTMRAASRGFTWSRRVLIVAQVALSLAGFRWTLCAK